jgi:cyclohexanone monooxygenase
MDANEGACDFVSDDSRAVVIARGFGWRSQKIRRKIDKIVKDPEKARKLKPYDVYARRPLCDGNASNNQKYFEQFNRQNVDIINLQETPIQQIEPHGVRTSDGKLHEVDLLIFATGFDAVEGNFTRVAIHGHNRQTLKDAWEESGPTSYLGVCQPGFPNLFMTVRST